MGDSDIMIYLSVLAGFVIVSAVVAFVVALCARKKAVRAGIGICLLAVAMLSAVLSLLSAVVVAALGVAALALAGRTPRGSSLEAPKEPGQEGQRPVTIDGNESDPVSAD